MEKDCRIPLWPTPRDGEFQPYLKPFLLDGEALRPAVIVCPGGAYLNRAPHESDPVSRRFNALGFHAFSLEYRVSPAEYPAPQLDALRAIKIVRANAGKWHIDPEKVLILGFSAGGHLAFGTTYLFEELDAQCAAQDAADDCSGRPDGAILCYAAGSVERFADIQGMYRVFDGEEGRRVGMKHFNSELFVTENTPPIFLWHTAADAGVSVSESLLLAEALREKHVPFGMAIYPFGPHGLGLAENCTDIRRWPETAAEFFNQVWRRKSCAE